MAATDIQQAVSAASYGDEVLVTDGVYVVSSAVLVTNGVLVRSVNGPRATMVDGNQSTRCWYLTHVDAVIEGFTITNGMTSSHGAGVRCDAGTVRRCVITGNNVGGMPGVGGAAVDLGNASNAVVENCLIVGNTVPIFDGAGGVYGKGCVRNCTIAGNVVGILMSYGAVVENSIVWSNSGGDVYFSGGVSEFSYSCGPVASNSSWTGTGFVTNSPQFAGAGDYHLRSTSPCVNSGTNRSWVVGALDVEGVERMLGGRVDMGCYEQSRDVGISGPVMVSPVAVPAGATNVFRTTNDLVWIGGTKETNHWVGAQTVWGGFATNGIEQTFAGTAWSNTLPLVWASPMQTYTLVFSSASAELDALSPSGTVLYVTDRGFGPPSVGILSYPVRISYNVTNLWLGGENNAHVLESIRASSEMNGVVEWLFLTFPKTGWLLPSIALAPGTNTIWICGSNIFGVESCDSFTIIHEDLCDGLQISNREVLAVGGIHTGAVYQWQQTEDLVSSVWSNVGTVATAVQSSVSMTGTISAGTHVYRIVEIEP